MTENIQKEAYAYERIDFLGLFKLVILFAVKKLNLQHVLYFAAFLTFGIGDGITAAHMMEKLGAGIESNPLARYLFMTQGFGGMVMAKIWITVVILFTTYIVQMRSAGSMYWGINGFLIALTAGGIMAINANLTAIAGEIPQTPGEIIFVYISLVLMLTEVGGFMDKRTAYAGGVINGQ